MYFIYMYLKYMYFMYVNNTLPLSTDLYMKLHTELGRLWADQVVLPLSSCDGPDINRTHLTAAVRAETWVLLLGGYVATMPDK